MKIKQLYLLFTFLIFGANIQADDFREIKDLTENCYFNNNNEALPYVKGNGLNPDAIHFYLELHRYKGDLIQIKHAHPFAIFIEGELKKYVENGSEVIWNIDSLTNTIKKDRVLITVFSKLKDYDDIKIAVVKKILLGANTNEIYEIESKINNDRSVFLIIMLLLLIYLTILLNTNHKSFIDFYSFSLILIGRVKDESIYKSKLFSQENLLIYLFHSFVLSFLVITVAYFSKGFFSMNILYFNSVLLNWILFGFLTLLFFLFKYLFIKYLGVLFDLSNAANYYYYEFMRISMTFFLFLFILSAVFLVGFPFKTVFFINTCLYLTITFVILRFVILFARIGKMATFKKIHLFSYLCTTESIPILIGVKYLIF